MTSGDALLDIVVQFRIAAHSGMKPPTISIDPASQEGQATTAVESRPRVVTGPYQIDTSK